MDQRKPYCLHVFLCDVLSRLTKKNPPIYGMQGWNPDSSHEPGRLPGSGSFTWVGIVAVRKAAMEYLSQPHTFQVQVLTNQSRKLYIWNKDVDGRISGYRPEVQ
jgi:hypothetical protein